MIDDLMNRGLLAAAANVKRVVCGPSPADRKLHAWIRADEPVVIELRETLETLRDTATYRRRMGSMFGKKAKAATLTGFTQVSGTVGSSGGGGGGGGGGSTHAPGGLSSSKSSKKKSKKGDNKAAGATTPSSAPRDGDGGKPKVGSLVKEKRIFPYADGSYSIGAQRTATHVAHLILRGM